MQLGALAGLQQEGLTGARLQANKPFEQRHPGMAFAGVAHAEAGADGGHGAIAGIYP
ncbi:hypothetical protein D3C81_2305740 [compost metagenome]